MYDKVGEFISMAERLQREYAKRNALITYCRQVYKMSVTRDGTYLGKDSTAWRAKVPPEYWEISAHGHNSVDICDAVLGGHPPQFKVTTPSGGPADLPDRAEKFLMGVLRVNSRRNGMDVVRRAVHRTVLDGGCGIRVTWDPLAPDPKIGTLETPEGETWTTATYPRRGLPITLEVVKLDTLYPLGRPTQGSPFNEIFQCEERSVASVLQEWGGVEGADVTELLKIPRSERPTQKGRYIQWWGYDDNGEVLLAVSFRDKWVRPPEIIGYPRIPFVLAAFKEGDEEDPALERVPFIYPILWAVEREEYIMSRVYRIIDMLSNMQPFHTGPTPVNVEGTWGRIMHFPDPQERLQFPNWPGNPPDVWRLLEDVRRRESQGTFSAAMYGEVSTRISGYGLSQLIGADTLRTDTPRANLEEAFSGVAELIFDMLHEWARDVHIVVTVRVKNATLSAMLSGEETELLEVDTLVKPKQTADELRLATIGAQLASMPRPPLSTRTILETFFGIAQPEEEMRTRLEEEALQDPMVRLMAMVETLREEGSPYALIVEAQLQKMVEAAAGGAGGAGGAQGAPPPGPEQLGMGLPQGAMGNPPNPLDMAMGANLQEEAQVGRPTVGVFGGPPEQGGV